MTMARLGGKNPEAEFTKKIGSRLMFYREDELIVKAENRRAPQAKFSRVNVGGGAFVWAPTNVAGQNYLISLSEEKRDEFLYHSPPAPEAASEKPDSRRIVDGRPIKGLPTGHRENDYFDADGNPRDPTVRKKSPERNVTSHKESGPTTAPTEEYIQQLRSQISAGTF